MLGGQEAYSESKLLCLDHWSLLSWAFSGLRRKKASTAWKVNTSRRRSACVNHERDSWLNAICFPPRVKNCLFSPMLFRPAALILPHPMIMSCPESAQLAIIEQLYGHWAIDGYTDSSTRRWCRMLSSRSQLRRCFVFWLCGSWCFRFRNPSGIRSNMFFDFLSETLTFKWGKFGGWYVPCRTDHCLCTFRHDDTDTGVLNALGVSSTFKHVQTLRHIVVFVVFLYIYIYWSSKSGLVPNVGI